ncbi:membrane protein [Streptomyces mangrovisoli]|uniref:Uncharacterized protein n=1 Tax=Streptomyces mangrovisoli TaxID=1428628 RepID=A0A1J4NR77_9ACTN|nr:membrane protein [Streptomyces mangrovisoli]OIJ63654.1 hypothetical protein WN71_033085 [Streptomyces mangrovisoli]
MTKLLLSLHVLAAILAVGPVTVAASMFPATLRRALGPSGASTMATRPGDGDALPTLRTLHRICRVYAALGVAVPVFGLATADSLGVLGDTWLITSIVLTTAAAAVLALLILPAQERALAEADGTSLSTPAPPPALRAPGRLAMLTGVFNLLWATVTVLMIIRPGSTTGT